MRSKLVAALFILTHWGMPARAQAVAPPTSGPAATNWFLPRPPAKRLFFFPSDPKSMGRPAAQGLAAPRPIPQGSVFPNLRFHPTGLLPLEKPPAPDLWRFLKPKNTRLFFFGKP